MIRQHSVQRPAAIPPDLWAERAASVAVPAPAPVMAGTTPTGDYEHRRWWHVRKEPYIGR